ncbi:hypothetical protein RhiirA4_547804 [Rhizophagus irregularis]|uniref:Protein kinase domain-containing protein n=1 Tax=Rhizophagus irregularis TaxID=588596 RepID=A0A2I1H4E1_9GLOM|nr:hypothetical protein RhiirA4_547804 [Rhizophagus irregularis]
MASMTETANQEWRDFNRSVILNRHIPGGQFPVFPANARDLHVEDDAKLRFYSNVLYPVEALLGGAEFKTRFTGMLGVSDFILCTNNPIDASINDTVDNRLDRVMDDNFTSYDDDYIPPGSSSSKKRKSSSIQTGSKKRVTAPSSKGITTTGKYISSGTFGKVFSGYYDGQLVAWKTCDAYKEQEATKMLEHEAHITLF